MTTLIDAHRSLLQRWRKTMNLVGPGPLDPHYADSAEAVSGLQPSGRWADLGSGAGFPGVVFAASYPGVTLDLIDSRAKRCVFLNAVLAEADAGPELRVLRSRLEDLPAHQWDGVMARALAPWPKVLDHARHLLRPGGQALLLTAAHERPMAPGFSLLSERTYRVGQREHRVTLLSLSA